MAAQRRDRHRAKIILSVAMCTYNGDAYLRQQLLSIAKQTRLPGELVVCDDASTDATLQVLDEFQAMAPFPVQIYRSGTNLGPTKNFEKAIMQCSGDIIVLCDQDDVWMPGKLEELERVLEDHPEAGYVFSDALVVDEMLRSLGYTIWQRVSFTRRQRRRFRKGHQLEVLLNHNVVTGATMAFRSDMRELVLPIPNPWVHDAWISLLASGGGTRGIFIDEPLIKYRQHSRQVLGGVKVSFREQFQRALSTKGGAYSHERTKYLQVINRLTSVGILNRDAQELIEAKIRHLEARQLLYSSSLLKRIKTIPRELIAGRYHKFSNGWKSVAKDLFIAIK